MKAGSSGYAASVRARSSGHLSGVRAAVPADHRARLEWPRALDPPRCGIQHAVPVAMEERQRVVEPRELLADGRADRRPEHLASKHRLGVAVDDRAVVAALARTVERRMMHDQQARLRIDAQGAAWQVGEQGGMVSEHEPGADCRIGVEQVRDPLVQTAPDSRVDGMRKLEDRALELDQPGAIAGRRLSAQFLDHCGRSAPWEPKVANGDYVIEDAWHEPLTSQEIFPTVWSTAAHGRRAGGRRSLSARPVPLSS